MVSVAITNTNQLAQDQARAMEKTLDKTLKAQVDHDKKLIKENHSKWASTFNQAESHRRKEEDNWRKFFHKVYNNEKSWWQKIMFFVLNGIQLVALKEQYDQQKRIADRTYELADRQLRLAEGMFAYYKAEFQPHETEMAKQIDGYFANPYQPQYEITSGRFALNARMGMIGKRREVLMCASEYCTGATTAALTELSLQEAKNVANAMNSAVKYEKLRETKLEQKWLNARLAFIQAGRGVAKQGITGIDGAVHAFHSFGADPGAALSQLLSTVAFTVGGIIPSAQQPTGGQLNGVNNPYVYREPVGVHPQPRTAVSY